MLRAPLTRILTLFIALTMGIAVYSGPTSFVMLPLCAVVGPLVGLTSDAPHFTPMFKAVLLAGLEGSAALVLVGVQRRTWLWGQLLVVIGAGLWVVYGGIGFGPQ